MLYDKIEKIRKKLIEEENLPKIRGFSLFFPDRSFYKFYNSYGNESQNNNIPGISVKSFFHPKSQKLKSIEVYAEEIENESSEPVGKQEVRQMSRFIENPEEIALIGGDDNGFTLGIDYTNGEYTGGVLSTDPEGGFKKTGVVRRKNGDYLINYGNLLNILEAEVKGSEGILIPGENTDMRSRIPEAYKWTYQNLFSTYLGLSKRNPFHRGLKEFELFERQNSKFNYVFYRFFESVSSKFAKKEGIPRKDIEDIEEIIMNHKKEDFLNKRECFFNEFSVPLFQYLKFRIKNRQ